MLVKTGEDLTDKNNLQTEDGGLKYDIVLQEARTKRCPRPKSAPANRQSREEIQQKLKVKIKFQLTTENYLHSSGCGGSEEEFRGGIFE